MKKLILILALLFTGIVSNAQNVALDLAVLAGGVGYQKFATQPKMDNVLHCWGGYFGCNALTQALEKSNCKKWVKKVIPPVVTIWALAAKEMTDGHFSNSDFKAGLMGVSL